MTATTEAAPTQLLPMCPDAICDGEEHYSGYRDRETNEDIVTGPCPRWSEAGSATTATTLAAAIALGLWLLAGGFALHAHDQHCHAQASTPAGHELCEGLNQ